MVSLPYMSALHVEGPGFESQWNQILLNPPDVRPAKCMHVNLYCIYLL